MENLVLFVHLITALAIIGLILLQRGKGAEMGASFGGGASQTLFGAGGSGNFFSRMTGILATVFFITSFSLAVIAKQQTGIDTDIPLPELEQYDPEVPAIEENEVPALDAGAVNESEVPEVPAQ